MHHWGAGDSARALSSARGKEPGKKIKQTPISRKGLLKRRGDNLQLTPKGRQVIFVPHPYERGVILNLQAVLYNWKLLLQMIVISEEALSEIEDCVGCKDHKKLPCDIARTALSKISIMEYKTFEVGEQRHG